MKWLTIVTPTMPLTFTTISPKPQHKPNPNPTLILILTPTPTLSLTITLIYVAILRHLNKKSANFILLCLRIHGRKLQLAKFVKFLHRINSTQATTAIYPAAVHITYTLFALPPDKQSARIHYYTSVIQAIRAKRVKMSK